MLRQDIRHAFRLRVRTPIVTATALPTVTVPILALAVREIDPVIALRAG